MPFEYLDDWGIADIAFRAWAEDLPGLFAAAADATLHVMVDDLESVRPAVARALSVESEALDLLLFAFLGELVFRKDAERLLLRVPDVRVVSRGAGFRLEATARGEPIDAARHATRVDVKAVTLHGLEVRKSERGWEARVLLDV